MSYSPLKFTIDKDFVKTPNFKRFLEEVFQIRPTQDSKGSYYDLDRREKEDLLRVWSSVKKKDFKEAVKEIKSLIKKLGTNNIGAELAHELVQKIRLENLNEGSKKKMKVDLNNL